MGAFSQEDGDEALRLGTAASKKNDMNPRESLNKENEVSKNLEVLGFVS